MTVAVRVVVAGSAGGARAGGVVEAGEGRQGEVGCSGGVDGFVLGRGAAAVVCGIAWVQ